MRTTTDFAVLIVVPKTSSEFTPKNRTATSAAPQVTTTLAITPRITSSATSSQPHGTRKSSESPARYFGASGRRGMSCRFCGAGSEVPWRGIPWWKEELLPVGCPEVHSNEPWQGLHRTDCDRRRPFQSGKAPSGVLERKDTTNTLAAVFPAAQVRGSSSHSPSV